MIKKADIVYNNHGQMLDVYLPEGKVNAVFLYIHGGGNQTGGSTAPNFNGIAYAKHYFKALADLPNYGSFDILGHFDLLTKFNEKEPDLFDTADPAYRAAATEAAEALVGKVKYFEVNTGAISRGYRTTPYPDPYIIKEMKRLGFGAIISSDCHDRNFLDCGYEDAKRLLK